jgi:hypothetical protein
MILIVTDQGVDRDLSLLNTRLETYLKIADRVGEDEEDGLQVNQAMDQTVLSKTRCKLVTKIFLVFEFQGYVLMIISDNMRKRLNKCF